MAIKSAQLAESIRMEVENLIDLVSGEESQQATADQMEGQLWWSILEVGLQLLQLFFAVRHEQEPKPKRIEVAGVVYKKVKPRERQYGSVFGEVPVWRAAYWKKGAGSQFPLEEALSLPERQYSDWVQEMAGQLSVSIPYAEAVSLLGQWFKLGIPKGSAQAVVADHAAHMASYYEQLPPPAPGADDRLLVVTADGKGIPMTRQDSPPPEARRGDEQRKTATKEATVTAVYTIAPYRRTADDIIRALLRNEEPPMALPPRPHPNEKRVFGTLAGQAAAFEHLVQQSARYDAPQLRERVALTDGDRGLKRRVAEHLPDFTLIIDIMHVTGYLWKAADALLGKTHPWRTGWMADALQCLLANELDTLLNHLDYHLRLPGLSPTKQATLTQVITYLRNNRPHMDYQRYLARGWPIGTGVVEGACRHLVCDRFDRTGMRWSLIGAQVMLDVRAVVLNADWHDFQRFRRHRAHQQRYGAPHPALLPELAALNVAA